MYNLHVEKRDKKEKAKKIRQRGFVPCNVNGGSLGESLLFIISENEANKLIKEKAKGAVVTLICDKEDYLVLMKSISFNTMTKQVEDIAFQLLEKKKVVSSVAKIMMKNKDKVPTMVQLLIPEIPYKSLPKDIIETVEIDLGILKPGDFVKIKDLAIAKNPAIELTASPEKVVLSIVKSTRQVAALIS